MLKKILVLSLLIVTLNTFAFSNIILFGDSLTDIGNMPESPQPFLDMHNQTIDTSDAAFYVPFSNPVDTEGTITPASSNTPYPYPNLLDHNLARQSLIQATDGTYTNRLMRSAGFAEFFLSFSYSDGITQSDRIIPSHLITEGQTAGLATSVDYAWGYALSEPGCANEHYAHLNSCDVSSINTARQTYVTQTQPGSTSSARQTARSKLQIPGAPEQVQQFIRDMQSGKVQVNAHTLYSFWIGGNDLLKANNAMSQKNYAPMLAYILGHPADNTLNAIHQLLTALPPKDRNARIYIFNKADPGTTPDYAHSQLKQLAHFVSQSYNYWLTQKVNLFNAWYHTHVQIVPVFDWYNDAAALPQFKAHLGEACQTASHRNFNVSLPTPNDNCQGFLYWNGVHPASPLQAYTGFRLEQAIKVHRRLTVSDSIKTASEEAQLIQQIINLLPPQAKQKYLDYTPSRY